MYGFRSALPTPKVLRASRVALFLVIFSFASLVTSSRPGFTFSIGWDSKHPAAIAFAQTESPIFAPHKDRAPPIGAAHGSCRYVSKVCDIVKTDMAPGLLVLVGHFQRQLDDLSALPIDPELALADLHLLDRFHLHRCMVFHELENTLVREVLHAEDTDCKSDLAPTSRRPIGYSWPFLTACIWQGVPTIPTLSRPKLRVASLIMETFGLRLYLVPRACHQIFFCFHNGRYRSEGFIVDFENVAMHFDGFFMQSPWSPRQWLHQ